MAQFTIRVRDEIRDRIKKVAGEDHRSMNGEIEWLLESALCQREILGDAVHAGRVVRHKDGNIHNNEIGNIEIVDAPEESER